jgi:BA14K-like protein
MRIILAAVGVLGISLIGVAAASAIPMNAASLDAAAKADSPMMKVVARNFNRWPGCEHLRSFNPQTRMFIGRDGKQHPCVRPPGH